jgi:hypothetical protein
VLFSVIVCRKENVLVVNLGSVKVTSLPRDRSSPSIQALHSQGTSQEEIMQAMISQSYDRFRLNLEQMQVCATGYLHFKWVLVFRLLIGFLNTSLSHTIDFILIVL